MTGSPDLLAYDLNTQQCEINISGSGDCHVHVKDLLDARSTGSGDVSYKGSLSVNSTLIGSGKL